MSTDSGNVSKETEKVIDLLAEDRMAANRIIWDAVQVTDPHQVKEIVGKDYKGFSSPNPYWLVRRLTETFGPMGVGWGWRIVSERFEKLTHDETLHVAMVALWYVWDGKRSEEIQQMGQTKAVYLTTEKGPNNPAKIKVDEDAPKKSVTDAFVKCASYLGFAGDIFSGMWNDSKYQDRARDYWADGKPRSRRSNGPPAGSPPPANPPANQPKPKSKSVRELPEVVTDAMLAAKTLSVEVAKTGDEVHAIAQELFWWHKNGKLDRKSSEHAGRAIVQRYGELVTVKDFPKYRQMMDALGKPQVTDDKTGAIIPGGMLEKSECDTFYQLARTRLNIVDEPVGSNSQKGDS